MHNLSFFPPFVFLNCLYCHIRLFLPAFFPHILGNSRTRLSDLQQFYDRITSVQDNSLPAILFWMHNLFSSHLNNYSLSTFLHQLNHTREFFYSTGSFIFSTYCSHIKVAHYNYEIYNDVPIMDTSWVESWTWNCCWTTSTHFFF